MRIAVVMETELEYPLIIMIRAASKKHPPHPRMHRIGQIHHQKSMYLGCLWSIRLTSVWVSNPTTLKTIVTLTMSVKSQLSWMFWMTTHSALLYTWILLVEIKKHLTSKTLKFMATIMINLQNLMTIIMIRSFKCSTKALKRMIYWIPSLQAHFGIMGNKVQTSLSNLYKLHTRPFTRVTRISLTSRFSVILLIVLLINFLIIKIRQNRATRVQ